MNSATISKHLYKERVKRLSNFKVVVFFFNLSQLNSFPTRLTKPGTTLSDLIASNSCPQYLVKQAVVPFNFSDHDLILCVRKVNARKIAFKIM